MSTGDSIYETREQYLERRVRNMSPMKAPRDHRPDYKALAEALAAAYAEGRHGACQLVDSSGDKVPVPDVVFFVMKRVAEILARGDSVATVPVGRELSTQKAADVLRVPLDYLVGLLDEGSIPYTQTGEHRCMHVEDVLAFKYKQDRKREAALAEIARFSQEHGGGYE